MTGLVYAKKKFERVQCVPDSQKQTSHWKKVKHS